MSGWSPPSLPRSLIPIIAGLYVLIAAYAVVIAQQLLVGVVFPGVVLLASYLLWRILRAIEAIADALQRIADAHESDNRTRGE
jgi:hypothetical protein